MIVYADQLLHAADQLVDEGVERRPLVNGVTVTAAQLRKAGEILRDGPQPICNGIKDKMPGFIESERQTGKSLTFQVGILSLGVYRIDAQGRARKL